MSAISGVLYGLLMRGLFSEGAEGVMSVAFLFGVPFVIGFLGASRTPTVRAVTVTPLLTVGLMVTITGLVGLEGSICIVMSFPLLYVMAVLGGLLAMFLGRSKKTRTVLMIAPLLIAPVEQQTDAPDDLREVVNEIFIAATPATVWANIVDIPEITEEEFEPRLVHRIGFPRPLSAHLSGHGVGAVRHALFEGELLFVETITEWEEPKALGFSIRADTEHIPATTLDEHVTIGGPFFDILDGRYELIPRDGGVLLRLSSRHRMSTRFNFYATWWSDLCMSGIQASILDVMRARCEAGR